MDKEKKDSTNKIISARYFEDSITSTLDDVSRYYLRRGYGVLDEAKKIVEYSLVEALFLLEMGRMRLFDLKGEEVNFDRLLKESSIKEPTLWRDYIVYRDLRKRNYVVKDGFSSDLRFRVFERGEYMEKPARYLIAIVYEGRDLPVERLIEWLEICRNNKKELILAVVDRRNEVIYYTVRMVDLVP
ncbi:MAG: tRNA-intron lyase [Nitrososphaerota archaeon]